MGFLAPVLPEYAADEFARADLPTRLRLVCRSWATQGYGSPSGVYLFYLAKVVLYVAGWIAFASLSDGTGGWRDVGDWWSSVPAFQKAVVWTLAFEGLGLASGSGPLTGRYVPPFGGAIYFLRPGTTKLPLVPGLPVLGRLTRSWVDVAIYLVHYGLLVRALVAPSIGPGEVLPVVASLLLLGVADKTAFLAARPDHYLAVLVAFAFVDDALAASKLIWVAVWWGAATSKLNRHFPHVVATMLSNSPLTAVGRVRQAMWRRYPDDLRPSALAAWLAHGGTVVEYLFPLVLVVSTGGAPTVVALAVMLAFHLFITSSVPMGVPIEWNLMMMYGGLVLFGEHAGVRAWDLGSPLLVAILAAFVVLVVVGNYVPRHVSFLLSMRYYAGNWPFSVWLFRGDAMDRLDERLVKPSKNLPVQLAPLYDDETVQLLLPKVMAFRAMHLHGRCLAELVPRAVDDVRDHVWMDGELVAGMVLGWNFGDGHLHREQLLAAVQAQVGYASGELRVLMVESQPMGRPRLHWRIHDAADGLLEEGEADVRSLVSRQPWEPGPAVAPAPPGR